MLLQDSIDHLAARVHQTWYEETRERIKQCLDHGDTPQAERYQNSAYFQPWTALRNEQKEENRGAADHRHQTACLGLAQPANMDPAEVDATVAKLDGNQLEALAEMGIDAGQQLNG